MKTISVLGVKGELHGLSVVGLRWTASTGDVLAGDLERGFKRASGNETASQGQGSTLVVDVEFGLDAAELGLRALKPEMTSRIASRLSQLVVQKGVLLVEFHEDSRGGPSITRQHSLHRHRIRP